jgi:hydroxymethylbilane synthase
MKPLRIGTRSSALALWQAHWVQNALLEIGLKSELVPIHSSGDTNLVQPLYEMGVVGVFTKELDQALLQNEVDICVHSMKDVPTQLPAGIVEGFVPERGPAGDVFVFQQADWKNLSQRTIATSSLRRQAQWLFAYKNDRVVPLRGNIQTRLDKIKANNWDGAIFAKAGLERLSTDPKIYTPMDWMIPAPAQGAIMVTTRADETKLLKSIKTLSHLPTYDCVRAERDFLRALQGGCSAPIGAYATVQNDRISFVGSVTAPDGSRHIGVRESFDRQDPDIGKQAAEVLVRKGGEQVLKKLNRNG